MYKTDILKVHSHHLCILYAKWTPYVRVYFITDDLRSHPCTNNREAYRLAATPTRRPTAQRTGEDILPRLLAPFFPVYRNCSEFSMLEFSMFQYSGFCHFLFLLVSLRQKSMFNFFFLLLLVVELCKVSHVSEKTNISCLNMYLCVTHAPKLAEECIKMYKIPTKLV